MRGIGPCYADKAQRATAIRVGDLLRPELVGAKIERTCRIKNTILGALDPSHEPMDPVEITAWALAAGRRLQPHVGDTTALLHEMADAGRKLLFEGANATLLDVDHGTYPYVTSSSCITPGIGPGTGLPTTCLGRVLGVMKAYSTRVGGGPFPTELDDAIGQRIRERGREYGTTTGRPRRVGCLDLVAVRYATRLNGATGLVLTLLDVLTGLDELRVCVEYRLADGTTTRWFRPDAEDLARVEPVYETLEGFAEELTDVRRRSDLPGAALAYVEMVEREVGLPIELIGVGPARDQIIRS